MEGPLFQQTLPFRPIPVYGQRLQPATTRVAAPDTTRFAMKSVDDSLTLAKHLNLISHMGHMRSLGEYPFGQLSYLRNITSSQYLHGVNKFGVKNVAIGAETRQPHAIAPQKLQHKEAENQSDSRENTGKSDDAPVQTDAGGAERNQSARVADGMTVPVIVSCANPFTSQYGYGRKVFPCPQCRYTTDRRNNLKRHMLTMHQTCSKTLECCGIMFATKASLREHAMIFHYHGYTCFYCGRRFCRKALLKRHLSVHNGQKDFVCPVCDYATSHKSNLERHRKVHCRPEDSKPDDDMHYGTEHASLSWRPDETSYATETSIRMEDDSEDEEINVESD